MTMKNKVESQLEEKYIERVGRYGMMVEVMGRMNLPMLVPPNFWTIHGLEGLQGGAGQGSRRDVLGGAICRARERVGF